MNSTPMASWDQRLEERPVPRHGDPAYVRQDDPHGDGGDEPGVLLQGVAQAGGHDHRGDHGLGGQDPGEP